MVNSADKLARPNKQNVYFSSCKAAETFFDEMQPLLKGVLFPNKKEQLIISIYTSLYCWLKTIVVLNHTMHVQAVAAATRAIFEQLLDLKLIVDDKVNEAPEKVVAFREIEKFKMARKYESFVKKYPSTEKGRLNMRIDYALNKNNAQRVDELMKLWFPNSKKVDHWTGLGIDKRAELAGSEYERFYCESFKILSWFVHSGQVGNTFKEFLEVVYANSMRLAHEMFVDTARLTAKGLKLNIAVKEFDDWVEQVRLAPGFAILEEEKNKK